MVKPKMVYISNSTEIGTVYTKDELEAISKVCKDNNLYLFLDGARLASALASEIIYQTLLKAGVPIYVSMSETAASGGYYISMAGKKVFADNATITGSIGVVSMMPKFYNAQNKYGVTANTISKGKYSDMYNPFTPLTEETKTILIFDEVISGFRLALGGAQEFFGITPDLTTLGKIIGGGYPVGAFGGKKEIMDLVAPVGRVYHAGTLSGNPIASKAGFATISYLKENPNIYKELAENTNYLVDNIEKLAEKYGVDVCVNSMGSLFTIFFVDLEKVENLEDSLKANTENFSIYFNTMLDNGIVVPPSQFEAHFLSIAHTKKELDKTLEVIEIAFKKIGEKSGK